MTQITTTKKPAIVGTATAITIFRFDDDDDEDDDDGDQDDTDGDDDNDDGVGEKLAALRFSFVSGNREVFVSGDDELFSGGADNTSQFSSSAPFSQLTSPSHLEALLRHCPLSPHANLLLGQEQFFSSVSSTQSSWPSHLNML